jgi:beta-lactam-binding protein with PASTA domain
MKRALAFSFLSTLWLFSANAQTQPPQSKLSSHLRMLVSGDPALVDMARQVLLVKTGPQRPRPTVGAFVRFQGDADALRAMAAPYGAAINTVVGNLATAEIPIEALEQVASLPAVIRIEESRQVKPSTDVSVPATGANQVWYGANGPVDVGATNRGAMPPPWNGNTGQNVLVGIVDTGIDLNHKDFLVPPLGNTRIVSLWDQTAKTGTPPVVPGYPLPGQPALAGNECTNPQIMAVRQKIDVAVTDSYDEAMSFLPGNGSGAFGSPSTFVKGHTSVAVAAGDFNLDGNMDLVTGNLDGTISWVQGNGQGSFVPQSPITVAGSQVQITFVAVGDFNGDGIPDVVAVLNNTNQIAILLGNGNGTFQAPSLVPVGNGPTSVAVGDLNGDGTADLVVTNYYDGTVSVLLGDGQGNFTAPPGSPFPVSTVAPNYPYGAFPSYVAIGDFNGDGKPDLAVANWGRQSNNAPGADLSILLGNGDGTFGTPSTISTGHFEMAVAVGDFNGDGKLDLALQGYSAWVDILLGNGDGTFGNQSIYSAGGTVGLYSGQATLVLGDFNQDGILDVANLVRSNSASSSDDFYDGVAVLLGKGDGTFLPATVYPSGSSGNSTSLAIGNFHSIVCTETDLNGHGTQVAGIAAGNGSAGGGGALQTPYRYIGMAPQTGLIVVKTTFNQQDIVDGVAYIENNAAVLGLPVAINLSLGAQVGPHDGTSSWETMLSGLTGPGQIVVSAMGNEAANALHADGIVTNGVTAIVGLSVPAGLVLTLKSPLEFDLWYSGQDQIGVNVNLPGGTPCMNAPVYPDNGNLVQFQNANCGAGGITAFAVNPSNSDHEVQILLSNGANPIPQGNWSITLDGSGCGVDVCVTQGLFDIWATDTSSQVCCVAFTGSFVDAAKSISEPATATNLIAVGSYVTKTSWISRNSVNNVPTQSAFTDALAGISGFSSLGPRRGCSSSNCAAAVQKPDVAAPGEMIMASYAAGTPTGVCGIPGGGCLDPDGQHIAYAGTSQATPHVTGAVALLMAKYGSLSPCQVKSSLTNARTDVNTGTVPNTTWGFGKLAIDLAISPQPIQNQIVPSVVYQTLAAAQAAILTAGLTVGGITYGGSATVPVGSVIQQTPASGFPWCGGVDLVVSGIAVPNVSGDTLAAAAAAITGANLVDGSLTPVASLTVPAGQVIVTGPPAGTYVAPGSAVNLFIAGVPVPAVTGQTEAAARGAITGAGLAVGDVTFAGSQTVPVGSVISEDPFPGTEVLSGSTVNLQVSGIPVPNIVGQALAAGQAAVTGVNLTAGNVTAATSATVPVGDIISESPGAGTYVNVGSAVAMVVSGIAIPNEVGQALNAAEAGITGAGLAVGNVTQAASAVVSAGVVISENAAAGTVVTAGTAVNLLVSSGPGQLTVPNVVGFTQANAATAIQNIGLVVGTVTTATSATVAAGNVISESPAAGSPVNAGSAVSLVVSTGMGLQSIAVTPANPSIAAGTTEQFTATGVYSGNSTQNLTNLVTWASATAGVATVNGLGLATAHAVGASTISASLGAVSGSTVLTVTAPACDINHAGPATVADVQGTINQALGVSPAASDLNGDGVVNVADVQVVVNAVLNLGCN